MLGHDRVGLQDIWRCGESSHRSKLYGTDECAAEKWGNGPRVSRPATLIFSIDGPF